MGKKENIVEFPDQSQSDMEGAEWAVAFDEGGSPEQRGEFDRWLKESPRHRESFVRYSSLWAGLDRFKEFEGYAQADEIRSARRENPLEFASSTRRSLLALAATLLIVFGLGVLLSGPQINGSGYNSSYVTNVGESETVELPDGSRIVLNTDSEVHVSYSAAARQIRLVRGEGYFDVAEDKRRPFAVDVAGRTVEAVGTAFTVRLRDRKIDVTVSEGNVKLYAAPAPSAEQRREPKSVQADALLEVSAGQSVVFEKEIERVVRVEPAALKRKLAWRHGMLAFSGEPLSEMVAEVSRYTDVRIEIADEAIGELPVTAYFRVGDVDAMLEAFELSGDFEVLHLDKKYVRLKNKRLVE